MIAHHTNFSPPQRNNPSEITSIRVVSVVVFLAGISQLAFWAAALLAKLVSISINNLLVYVHRLWRQCYLYIFSVREKIWCMGSSLTTEMMYIIVLNNAVEFYGVFLGML